KEKKEGERGCGEKGGEKRAEKGPVEGVFQEKIGAEAEEKRSGKRPSDGMEAEGKVGEKIHRPSGGGGAPKSCGPAQRANCGGNPAGKREKAPLGKYGSLEEVKKCSPKIQNKEPKSLMRTKHRRPPASLF